MTTTTQQKTTLPKRTLPKLNTDPVLREIEVLGGELAELSQQRKGAMRTAVHSRAAAEQAAREVEAAAEKDRQAFREAALNDKPDPGRVHELKAENAAARAHREAEGATLAANALAVKLRQAIEGEAGAKLLADLDDRITTTLERLRDRLSPIEDDLGELAVLTALGEQAERTRKPTARGISAGRGPDVERLPKIGSESPARMVELLKVYDPRPER